MQRSDYTQNIGNEKETALLGESEYTGACSQSPIPDARLKATGGLCVEKPVAEDYSDNNYDSSES